ncbi:hypothetical protein EMIHUDRAFT_229256 [Emiliania huxleyi CCMP1516]|uniref:Uncharacterized protein n=2 Tax=Emiliania huxleyi TaxID=2903 RepID=A0A0D3I5Y4_EMIH1|nr:hypothetical protein EMIHUDRAFT_249755 [Emiliania huxleyi CCMP1516]XP_005786190.1 hypothetical protein EMIHUDRAFT_229256 [Emiliania huxleyi CCMP1516]EOD06669.1 hypothetical protein EMIHUDRAFT_249755 [Emiliania huxleyi CCMP1516]EOD33761.1 hypothetical protein EMIHUDRAFT_229256 [Emiliania huxleyi CCMP1516]|eukprot:XP_005759098.1 hypothetical protein EMIHUDRAFT_249755 [Emiliania huxleyi CCMP1516]
MLATIATSTADTVSKLLALVEPTDRGIAASDSTRAEASSLISALEESWAGTDAFASPYLLRNTEVVYVGQSSSKGSNAAGGKYRGRIGRALFRTDALFQHVLDDVAVNVVQFRLLGLVPGQAILRGAWRRDEETLFTVRRCEEALFTAGAWRRDLDQPELASLRRNSSRPLSPNTIAVAFEAPRVSLFGREGRFVNLQLGRGPGRAARGGHANNEPPSSVGLDVTYLDERVRICRGDGRSLVPRLAGAFVSAAAAVALLRSTGGVDEPRGMQW